MKFLVIDAPYSSYFKDVSEMLVSKGATVYNFLSTPSYFLYLRRKRGVLFSDDKDLYKFKAGDSVLKKVSHIVNFNNYKDRQVNSEELDYMAKFYLYIKNVILKKKIDVVLLYNDLRWHNSLIIDICNSYGVKYFVFERGVFRPFTTTIDDRGVNANSSLVGLDLDDPELEFEQNDFFDVKDSGGISKFTNKLTFLLFILSYMLFKNTRLSLKYQHNDYSLSNYLKVLFSGYQKKKRSVIDVNLPSQSYIFVPLQLPNDTQTLIFSEFKDTQDFIDCVEQSFYNSGIGVKYKLCFKVHPMDYRRYSFSKESIISSADTKKLVKNSNLVLTINSTVGFEALVLSKQCITLGETFYSHPDVVIKSDRLKLSETLSDWNDGRHKVNREKVEAFISIVKNKYQIKGSIFNYKKTHIDSLVTRIFDKLDQAA